MSLKFELLRGAQPFKYLCNKASGYRCIDNNKIKRRPTTHHMGNALDLQILNKNSAVVSGEELENIIRKEWFGKYLNTQIGWKNNQFGLEGLSHRATTWVHLDVREFNDDYKSNYHYSKTKEGLNREYLINIFRNDKVGKSVLACAGHIITSSGSGVVDKSLEELIKMLGDVISHGEGGMNPIIRELKMLRIIK